MYEADSLSDLSQDELNRLRKLLLADFLLFHRVMFKKLTHREFMMSHPIGNESHFITFARELTNVFLGQVNRLYIGCPPGWAKSALCKSFISWCFAHYPDCKFLYISHSFELASMHTDSIKQTLIMPIYKKLFGVEIRHDSKAKDFFQTTKGGAVAAFGSQGGITGRDAGLPGLDRFSGGIVIDDIHKPEDIHSDTMRDRVKRNYFETIERRLRSPNIPIIMVGQRLHEDDLPAHLLNGADGREWRKCIIKALDEAGNARYPEVNPLSDLLLMQQTQPYVFASQYQQDPLPAGGGLFKKDDFPLLDYMPDILATFVTCDSAETIKDWNDATVFSFWGIYKIKFGGHDTDLYGLHWLDCIELRVEPKDLEQEFLDFWANCMHFKVKPKLAAIEKKSTGVTLISTLKNIPGLRVVSIERAGTKNSKTNRFISMQKYIGGRQISLPYNGKHTQMCLTHMAKITATDVHRFDDICDTVFDAVKMALIDKTVISTVVNEDDNDQVAKTFFGHSASIDRLRQKAYTR